MVVQETADRIDGVEAGPDAGDCLVDGGVVEEVDARLTAQIALTLSARSDFSALDAHAVAESFSLGMRVTFDEWVRRADAKVVPLREIYAEVRTALARAWKASGR